MGATIIHLTEISGTNMADYKDQTDNYGYTPQSSTSKTYRDEEKANEVTVPRIAEAGVLPTNNVSVTGTVVDWRTISGTTKAPQDSATFGAKSGDNLQDSSGTILDDVDVVTDQGTSLDTTLVNTIASATVQGRAENLFKQIVFLGSYLDGLTETAGTGSITRNLLSTYFNSGSTNSGGPAMGGDSVGRVNLTTSASWDTDMEINCTVSVTTNTSANTDGNAGWGMGDFVVPQSDSHVMTPYTGFRFYYDIDNAVLYASNTNAPNETRTDVSGGITITNMNNYRIVYDAGTSCKFYINDVLVATHTTNLPTGSNDFGSINYRIRVGDSGSTTNYMLINNNYQMIINI